MCRNLISVDWRGFVYDCDFNQMLDLPLHARRARARASVRAARRRPRRQPDPRRRPLLRLHRGPGLELRRRAEGGGGVSLAHGRTGAARRPDLPGRLPLSAARVRPRRPTSPATRSTSPAGSTATSQALDAIERLARRRATPPTIVFNGDFHWFDAEPAWFAEIERRVHAATRRCAATSRPRSRAPTTSARAAAAPIRRTSTRTWCGAPTTSCASCARQTLAAARARLARSADAPRRARRRAARRHRARRRGLARRLALCQRQSRPRPPTSRWLDDVRARLADRPVRLDPHLPRCAARFRAACRPPHHHQQWCGRHAELYRLPLRRRLPRRDHALAASAASTASSATASTSTPSPWITTTPRSCSVFWRAGRTASAAHQSYFWRIASGPDYPLACARG